MGTQPTKTTVLLGTIFTLSMVSPIASAVGYSTPGDTKILATLVDDADGVSTDNANTADATQVDEVITVIGRSFNTPLNIAANVNIIDAAAIEMSGATTLTDVLRGQSGIQISDTNSGPVFSLRGFSGSQAANNTLILVDGRRLNTIEIAGPSINAIPLNQIERIEILAGSAGVLYGDQAVGGVINIITKAPDSDGGSVQLSGGSFNSYEAMADAAVLINDEWRLYGAASYNRGDNYRDHNANKTSSVLGRLQYQTDVANFFVEASYYDDNRELADSLTLAQIEADPRQSNATSPGAPDGYTHEMTSVLRSAYQHQLGDAWVLGADINYSDTLVTGLSGWGTPRKDKRSLLEFMPKAVANIATDNGDINIVTGFDLTRGESEFGTGRSNVQKVASVYVQASVPLSSTLSYVVGGRYADISDELVDPDVYAGGITLDNDAHALEFGLNYRPSNAHRLYVRADSNFRFAKVDEQAYTSPGVMGLKPQIGRSYEAGWDWSPKMHTLRLSVFRLDLEDEIVWDPSADKPIDGDFDGANVNADASRRYGASLDWDWQFTKMAQLGLEYNYIDAEFTDGYDENGNSLKGKALPWVAQQSGSGYISVDMSDNWQLYGEAVYTGERYIDGDNANVDPKLDSYILTNLALNYSYDVWLASLRVDNLFDKQYISAGFYSSWGNGYYSGTGRAVRLTASYRF